MKTTSKNFKAHEIKGILPDGTIILHEGIKRISKYSYLSPEDDGHINHQIIFKERYYDLMYNLYGEGDPELSVHY